MAAVSDGDYSIAANGDIRRTGTASTTNTVLEFHRWLQGKADDAQASGDDLMDITFDTPSVRSTDNIITLNSPYNIDDTVAQYLYDGSIQQEGGDTLYSGLEVLGTVETGTEIMIIQDDKIIPAWWGQGVNADAASSLITSMMIKTRASGADIDGKRFIVMARELGDQYKEFSVTAGLGNSVAAISTANDLNNTTVENTIRGWTTIVATEGFQLIDINGLGGTEEYYHSWTKGSQTLNETYEWTKLQSARSLETLAGADTGSDFVVDDGTTVGQAQSFTSNAVIEKLTEARFDIKVGAGSPTGPLTAELYASAGGVIPTGSALATSEEVLSSLITANYQEIIFRFNDNFSMAASTQYCIVLRHPTGDGSNYFHCDGSLAGGTVAGENNANENPAATWNAVPAADLKFSVKACPVIHTRPGEKHRGITHEIVYDGESGGPFTENAELFWGTRITYDGESGAFEVGRYVEFQPSGGGTKKNGGKILFDDTTGNVLYVALEDATGAGAGQLLDNDIITQIGGTAASADIATTIVDDNKGGGIGVLLALDDNGADGDLYIQLIHGVAPVDNLRISENLTRFALVNATVTNRPVSPEYIGASTGSNIIGAYGVAFSPTTDVGSSDLFTALDGTARNPPNNVTFTVTGLVVGDRVLVGPRSGSSLLKSQLTTDTTLSGATETLVQCSTAVPAGTPDSGTGAENTRLRVELDTGIYRSVQYDSFTGNDFSITAADDDWTGINVSTTPKDVFVAYIDVTADATEEAYSAVYTTDVDVLVRVRDGGATPIVPFDGNGTFGSVSSSLAAIRNSDA